jgi:hypothetical protein
MNALRHWICSAEVVPPSTARLLEALRQMVEADADHLPAIAWGVHALRRYRGRIFLTEANPPRLEPAQWSADLKSTGLDLDRVLGN